MFQSVLFNIDYFLTPDTFSITRDSLVLSNKLTHLHIPSKATCRDLKWNIRMQNITSNLGFFCLSDGEISKDPISLQSVLLLHITYCNGNMLNWKMLFQNNFLACMSDIFPFYQALSLILVLGKYILWYDGTNYFPGLYIGRLIEIWPENVFKWLMLNFCDQHSSKNRAKIYQMVSHWSKMWKSDDYTIETGVHVVKNMQIQCLDC